MTGPGLNVPLNDPRMPALRRVRPPAFLMMCVGGMNILLCMMLMASLALKVAPFGLDAWALFPGQPLWVPLAMLAGSIAAGALVIWAALSAVSLRSWGLVVVGALAALLPFSPACCVGIMAGGWMLFTINAPEVKKHFQ